MNQRTTGPASSILSNHDKNGLRLRNRLAVAPMTRVTATEEGVPTQAMHDYYVRFAKGGFGLVVTEGIYTDKAFSQGYPFQPGLADDEQTQAWAGITKAMHEHGAKMHAQLMHAGGLSQENRFRGHNVAPSSIRPKGKQMTYLYGEGEYLLPVAITESEIAEVIQGFADSAARAVQAGFDGIEIHGANGYLLDQFLSAETNQRTDRWGGDARGRVSLLVEVVKSVKAAVGDAVPVGIRISQGKVNDFTSKWPGRDADAELIFSSLADAGVAFIHVTEFEAWKPAFEGGQDSLVALARRFAPAVSIIANGSLHDIERSAEALALGADIVAVGRGALANPDLPKVIQAQRELRAFDSSILGPIANVKGVELAFTSTI